MVEGIRFWHEKDFLWNSGLCLTLNERQRLIFFKNRHLEPGSVNFRDYLWLRSIQELDHELEKQRKQPKSNLELEHYIPTWHFQRFWEFYEESFKIKCQWKGKHPFLSQSPLYTKIQYVELWWRLRQKIQVDSNGLKNGTVILCFNFSLNSVHCGIYWI